jgi:predicted GNAT family acetyltransferase
LKGIAKVRFPSFDWLANMSIQVQHNPEHRRFETQLDGSLAYLTYTFRGDAVCFDHTFVPEAGRGKGVAAALVREGLEEARRRQWKIVPACSYVASYIERHPEFSDLLA